MTDPRTRAKHLLATVCLVLGSVHAQAADENATGGNTFNTLGYPAGSASSPRGGAQTGQGRGGQGDATGLRSNQNINGTGFNGRQGAPGTNASDQFSRRFDATPPKPSEFQKFVEAATGRLLPLFGGSFFTDAGDTFAPVDNIPVSADYTVGPGDEIVLRAWGSIDVDYRSTVDRGFARLGLPPA